jgi:hypothetical protein
MYIRSEPSLHTFLFSVMSYSLLTIQIPEDFPRQVAIIITSCFRKSYFGLQVRGVGRDQTDVQEQAESQLHSEPLNTESGHHYFYSMQAGSCVAREIQS